MPSSGPAATATEPLGTATPRPRGGAFRCSYNPAATNFLNSPNPTFRLYDFTYCRICGKRRIGRARSRGRREQAISALRERYAAGEQTAWAATGGQPTSGARGRADDAAAAAEAPAPAWVERLRRKSGVRAADGVSGTGRAAVPACGRSSVEKRNEMAPDGGALWRDAGAGDALPAGRAALGRAHRLGPGAGGKLAGHGFRLPGAWRPSSLATTFAPGPVRRSRPSWSRSTISEPCRRWRLRRPTISPATSRSPISSGGSSPRSAGLSIDPVVVRQAWLEAYDQITSHAKPTLDEFARDADPFGKIGRRAVTVDITSVVRASDRSFRIAWVEHPYADGAPLPAENWSAILTVVIQTPRTEARLRQNPLGIYIDAISWAQELNGASAGGTP